MVRKIRDLKNKMNQGLISDEYFNKSINSYMGILMHCKGHKIYDQISKMVRAPS